MSSPLAKRLAEALKKDLGDKLGRVHRDFLAALIDRELDREPVAGYKARINQGLGHSHHVVVEAHRQVDPFAENAERLISRDREEP